MNSEDPAAPSTPAATPSPPPPQNSLENDSFDATLSHLPELHPSDLSSALAADWIDEPPQRRRLLPLVLFLATCASTFWVGATRWEPIQPQFLNSWRTVVQVVQQPENWRRGLEYMAALVGILLTHEMGHFFTTVRYGVPASFPLFIPVPINAIGTMGAVIGMDGLKANRRQIFDIGLAGPLAGLAVAIPVLWFGVKQLDLSPGAGRGEIEFYLPVVGQWMLRAAHPGVAWAGDKWIALSEINALFMAGWVGMLITGLNMLPISQLDGGHVLYALFRRKSHLLVQYFITLAILYVVVNLDEAILWTPMLLLVIFLGIHHPPTANDRIPLGPVRWVIGLASLAIPVLCFPLLGLR